MPLKRGYVSSQEGIHIYIYIHYTPDSRPFFFQASSSLAPSGTARDGTITVNPLVMRHCLDRMSPHKKGLFQEEIMNYGNYTFFLNQ